MENMAYITQAVIELSDIQKIAEQCGYRTNIFFSVIDWLNVIIGDSEKGEWWQWQKLEDEEELSFDDEAEYEILHEMKVQNMFVVQYYPKTLPTLAQFLKILLQQYGGWVDCRDGLKNAYTLETIEGIVIRCP